MQHAAFANTSSAMPHERREHIRYEPTASVNALLLWQDETGRHQCSAQVNDMSQGGCSLFSMAVLPPGVSALVRLPLSRHAAAMTLQCRVLSCNPLGDALQISAKFEQMTEQQVARLRSVLASDAYQPLRGESLLMRRKHWRVPQWAAYLTAQQLPVMPRSKLALLAFEAEKGSDLSCQELVELAHGDPFLCLCLLREAESRRSARLGHETSTPLAAVMQLGSMAVRELLIASPETDETRLGLAECEARAVMAGQLAAAWSSLRADAAPDEVSMAALLSEIGEMLLWHFAPELFEGANDVLPEGETRNAAMTQEAICGFRFQELTLKCAEIWKLPGILIQLIRGQDTARANLARVSRSTALHLIAGPAHAALPEDLAAAKRLIPQASLERLVGELKWVPADLHQALIANASQILECERQALLKRVN